MILGLIPARLNSSRLKEKALIKIDGLPMIVHTFKRAQMSKFLDKVIVCTDDNKIKEIVEKYGGISILTSKKHVNGTERISEVAKKFKSNLVVDIQGDEPLVSPRQIDNLIKFHLKNKNFDVVLPSMRFKAKQNNENIVKVVKTKSNKVLYFSRAQIPYNYSSKTLSNYLKHLSIISFKPKCLFAFSKLKRTKLEFIENIELLRAIENDFNVGTYEVSKQTFAVDDSKSLENVLSLMKKDIYRKYY